MGRIIAVIPRARKKCANDRKERGYFKTRNMIRELPPDRAANPAMSDDTSDDHS
jgi:hypothetical protein